jgi:hypothetical protein
LSWDLSGYNWDLSEQVITEKTLLIADKEKARHCRKFQVSCAEWRKRALYALQEEMLKTVRILKGGRN